VRGLVERITPRGLRWRLAAWFTLVMLLCTGIVFFAVYHGTGTEVRRQIDRELAGEAAEFAHNLRTAGPDNPQQLAQAARRYLRTQPFSVSSTLLFAVVPGGHGHQQPGAGDGALARRRRDGGRAARREPSRRCS
jgi:hypothetical protein